MDVELPDCCHFTRAEQNPSFLMVAVNGKPRNKIVQGVSKDHQNNLPVTCPWGILHHLTPLVIDEKSGWKRTKDSSIFSTVMIET